MNISFEGKSVLITGGSRGIGLAMAHRFARDGARVGICARGVTSLEAARADLSTWASSVFAAVCDVSDPSALEAFVSDAAATLGGIDVLVNNASASSQGGEEAAWEAGIATDLMGTVRATRAAVPFLEASGQGAIVNIASIRGLTGSARLPAYAAVKAAIISQTVSQAVDLSHKKIRVNAIAPGSTEFPGGSWERRRHGQPALYQATLQRVPWGRLGTADEVARVALFLASDAASWVTGQVIVVDGGQMHT